MRLSFFTGLSEGKHRRRRSAVREKLQSILIWKGSIWSAFFLKTTIINRVRVILYYIYIYTNIYIYMCVCIICDCRFSFSVLQHSARGNTWAAAEEEGAHVTDFPPDCCFVWRSVSSWALEVLQDDKTRRLFDIKSIVLIPCSLNLLKQQQKMSEIDWAWRGESLVINSEKIIPTIPD